MDYQTWNSKVLGVVLDVSLRHFDGRRILDYFKDGLIDYIRSVFDEDDVFYLYHPEIIEPTYKVGEHISAISNFETDGWKFRLNYALEQTFYVLNAEDQSFEKYLVLFTDRFDSQPLERLAKIKEREGDNCEIFVFSFGHGNSHAMSLNGINFVLINDLKNLSETIKDVLKYSHSQQLEELFNGREQFVEPETGECGE